VAFAIILFYDLWGGGVRFFEQYKPEFHMRWAKVGVYQPDTSVVQSMNG